MIKYRFAGITAALLAAMQMWAAPLTPQQSLDLALAAAPMKLKGHSAQYRLAMTRAAENGGAGVYLFTRGETGGFILTAADDKAPAFLGYGDRAFDADGQAAPAFLYWIDQIAREVGFAAGNAAYAPVRAAMEREPIAPMCTTKWNQDSPYNDMCPVVNGGISVTGCSATAAAQVLKYHNWPLVGNGEVSYTLEATGETLSIDLGSTSFNWDAMLDSYMDGAGTPEQREAVALLMKALGYGMSMMYSPTGSGAYSFNTARLLAENFRYDKGIRFLYRDWYTLADWNDIVYKSLSEYGPVIYNGQSNAGGHSFVCDGYDKDDLFHINWGWGGVSDGYFLLNALDPSNQGIGGSTSGAGFNYMQDIICDIRPDKHGDSKFAPLLAVNGNLEMKIEGDKLVIPSMVYNSGPGDVETGLFAVVFSPITLFGFPAGESMYSAMEIDGLEQQYGFRGIELGLEDIEKGRYKVGLAYSYSDDSWMPVMLDRMDGGTFGLTVAEDATSVASMKVFSPDIEDVVLPTSYVSGSDLDISATLINNSGRPVNGYAQAILIPAVGELKDIDKKLGHSLRVKISIADGKKRSLVIKSPITESEELADGDYRILIVMQDAAGGYIPLSEAQTVRYTAALSGVSVAEADDASGASVYYTLEGIRVAEVQPGSVVPTLPAGVYLVRTGNKTVKTVVR